MNTRPLRGWLVLFVLMMASVSVGLLASRKHWPPGLSPWRDWLSAQAAQPPGPAQAGEDQRPGEERQAAADGFEFPSDEAGKLLEEKLTPPKKLPMPAYPYVDKPRPARAPAAEELGRHLKLPPAESSAGTSLLPDERRSHTRTTAAIDTPPLAFEADPRRPTRPIWPHPQLAYVQGPDPQGLPPLALGRPHVERPTLQDDPTAVAARRSLLVPASLSPPVLPPPLKLTIPDPDEYRRIVHFANAPADNDPAVQHFQRPETPVLPVVEPKKK